MAFRFRTKVLVLVALIILVMICLQLRTLSWPPRTRVEQPLSAPTTTPKPLPSLLHVHEFDPWNSSAYLEGDAPTNHFRDRLWETTGYVTTWTDAGFTNIMMTYANLIYLGEISNRTPIVPPIVPYHHVDPSAGTLLFSEVFDLPYLRSRLRRPIIEWADIKIKPSDEASVESLGCWSAWAAGNVQEHEPRYNTMRITEVLGLDVSYTALPHHARRQPQEGGEYDWGVLFWQLVALIYPSSGHMSLPENLPPPFRSPKGAELAPDTHLVCFDILYFVTAGRDDDYEWTDPWTPSWRDVGLHMKFKDSLVDLARGYLREVFRVKDSVTIPPFIGIHIRHGDFVGLCEQKEDCFPPLSVYATLVSEVQEELFQKSALRIPDHHVLVTSDETDANFWEAVRLQGWRHIDHEAERTLETHGEWFITLVDVVAQSLSTGFVGTSGSTVSTVNRRRVEDWNNGVTRMLDWRNAK